MHLIELRKQARKDSERLTFSSTVYSYPINVPLPQSIPLLIPPSPRGNHSYRLSKTLRRFIFCAPHHHFSLSSWLLATSYRLLVTGYWLLATSYYFLGPSSYSLDTCCWLLGTANRQLRTCFLSRTFVKFGAMHLIELRKQARKGAEGLTFSSTVYSYPINVPFPQSIPLLIPPSPRGNHSYRLSKTLRRFIFCAPHHHFSLSSWLLATGY